MEGLHHAPAKSVPELCGDLKPPYDHAKEEARGVFYKRGGHKVLLVLLTFLEFFLIFNYGAQSDRDLLDEEVLELPYFDVGFESVNQGHREQDHALIRE